MGGGFFPDDLPSIDWRDTLPHRAFFIVSIVIAAILLVKEYAELMMEAIGQIPKSICFLYLVGAYTFVYVCFGIAVELEDAARSDAVVQMVRSSLVVGAMFMLIGPLLILSPVHKITVTSRIGRAVVGTAHRKESRYTALVFFLLLVAAQLVVIYSMALVLWSVFNLDVVDVIGLCVCYFLLSLFYLVVFYGSMTRSPVKLRGNDPVAFIRANLPWLEYKGYLYTYVCMYALKMLGILIGASILFDQDTKNHNSSDSSDSSAYAVSCTFFVLTLLALVAFAVFLLVEAFRVKKRVVEPGEEEEKGGDEETKAPVAMKRRAQQIGGRGAESRPSAPSASSSSSSLSPSPGGNAVGAGDDDDDADWEATPHRTPHIVQGGGGDERFFASAAPSSIRRQDTAGEAAGDDLVTFDDDLDKMLAEDEAFDREMIAIDGLLSEVSAKEKERKRNTRKNKKVKDKGISKTEKREQQQGRRKASKMAPSGGLMPSSKLRRAAVEDDSDDAESISMFGDVRGSASDGGDDAAETAHPGGVSSDSHDDSTHLVQFSFEVQSDHALTKTKLHEHINHVASTYGWRLKRGIPRIVHTSDGVWHVEVALYVPTSTSRATVMQHLKLILSTEMSQAKFKWD